VRGRPNSPQLRTEGEGYRTKEQAGSLTWRSPKKRRKSASTHKLGSPKKSEGSGTKYKGAY